MVRRVLKDSKVPGTSMGRSGAEAPGRGLRVCCKILGREPGWAVWEARCLSGPGGLNRRNFLKRKRENRGTQQLFRDFSAVAVASCAPTPTTPGLWTPDKQPQPTPEAHPGSVHTPISGLAAHGRPHLKQGDWTPPTKLLRTEPCRAYSLSRRKAQHPAEESCRARGDCIPQKHSTQ